MKLFPRYKIIQRDTYLNDGTVYTDYLVKTRFLLFGYEVLRSINPEKLRYEVVWFTTKENAEKYIDKLYYKIVETVVKEI